tara:strand:- start:250 stop:504 length:255 start_codon:yes stop_codon:yes gene_type:complete
MIGKIPLSELKKQRDDMIVQLAVAGLTYLEIENAIRDESKFNPVRIKAQRIGQIIRGYGEISHYDVPLSKRRSLWSRLRDWWLL